MTFGVSNPFTSDARVQGRKMRESGGERGTERRWNAPDYEEPKNREHSRERILHQERYRIYSRARIDDK